MPLLGTYMADNEVCDNVVLTCDAWEEYKLMHKESSLTPEQLVTYLGKGLLPGVVLPLPKSQARVMSSSS